MNAEAGDRFSLRVYSERTLVTEYVVNHDHLDCFLSFSIAADLDQQLLYELRAVVVHL
jgi:hypothetical protein